MSIHAASQVTSNYLKSNPSTIRKKFEKDGVTYFLINAWINGSLVWRSSSFGFRRFDMSPDGKTCLIYHTLVDHETKKGVKTIPASEWSDIKKLIFHIPSMIEYLSDPYRSNPHPKGIHHIPPSDSREILIGNGINFKFLYESKKRFPIELPNYDELGE